MPEFKNECCRTESLSLTKALEIARWYERVEEDVSGLSRPVLSELQKPINYTESNGRSEKRSFQTSKTFFGKEHKFPSWIEISIEKLNKYQ